MPRRKPAPEPFGVRLKALRTAAELSQAKLAARTAGKVSQQLIDLYERGPGLPSLDKAFALADALGVPIETLRP